MRRGISLLLLMVLLPSCTFYRLVGSTKLKTPEFKILGCELKKISPQKADADFIVSAYNPNPIGLKNVNVDYEVSFERKRLAQGRNASIELTPNGESTLVIPAEIALDDLARVLGPLVERILSNQRTIPLTIDASFHGQPTVYNGYEEGSLFSFRKRVTKTVEVTLPKEEIDKGRKQILNEIRKLF